MAFRIPPSIKLKVINMWLKAMSRDEIAHSVNIGYGSVSRILDNIRSTDIPDLDLLRSVALKIKNEGLTLNDVADAIKISNFLKKLGSSEEELEKLLLEMEVYGYKNAQGFHETVQIYEKIKEFEINFDISIDEIPEFLEEKKEELYKLENEIMKKILFGRNNTESQPFR